MGETLRDRVVRAAILSLIIAFWAWTVAALHGVWSIGILRGYLSGGMQPLSPSLPVTWGTFYWLSLGAPVLSFFAAFLSLIFAPQRFELALILVTWALGIWVGASDIAFAFQIDFGATWGPGEALRALYIHPVVTPFALVFGSLALLPLTRAARR